MCVCFWSNGRWRCCSDKKRPLCYHLCGKREQAAGTMKIRLLKKSRNIFHHADTPLRTSEALWPTYNTPTIITWIGPWRNVILCGDTRGVRAGARLHILALPEAKRSHLHEFEFFHSLHDDGEDDWQERRGKSSQERKRSTCGTPAVIYSLIPGAAMVILEMTTWEMPFTAAFFGTDTAEKSL